MEKQSRVNSFINLVDQIASNPLEEHELRIQRNKLKKLLGNCETSDWEVYRGINFLTGILRAVQRALMGRKN